MTLAMVFPGQGSQSPGMQADLSERFDVVRDTWSEADDVLGFDLWDIVRAGPAEKLAETTVTQPAMLAAGVAAWRAWQASDGAQATQMAGHSLGEYTALVCAGAVSFSDAMRVVKRRSELMQEAVPVGIGAMAAVLGLDDKTIMSLCDEASTIGTAEPVNFNSPGQVVIAGHACAVSQAVVCQRAWRAPSHRAAGQRAVALIADAWRRRIACGNARGDRIQAARRLRHQRRDGGAVHGWR